VGLVARLLEQEGIATALTSWSPGNTRNAAPPRATFTRLKGGATLGRPHDAAQQRRILEATLALLAKDAPLPYVKLDERWQDDGE
jgi:D-proline reductase (dithiol) PrdA